MSTGVGISFPLGILGSIGVGLGPATVSVGTSGQLPSSGQPLAAKPDTPAAEKSAPNPTDKPVEKPADKSPAS